LDESTLLKFFKIYEKQNEVDFFINKNAEQFLKEQFDIWLKNYLFDEENDFNEKRLKQLKALKEIAYKVIDFISQFENELVKIWNKPKFVLNSNYVITLDRIIRKKGGINLIKKIINHKGFEAQKNEWEELGLIDNFDENKLFIDILNKNELIGLNKEYQFLPIDTKYFDENIKLELLSLFEDLDNELDGWLIYSENYQALKTILPKFNQKIQMIYIDPPFNKEQDADYFYSVKYLDATWITLLENRIELARDLLNDAGNIFVRCDYNGNMYVRLLLNKIFGKDNFKNEIVISRTKDFFKSSSGLNKFIVDTDTLFLYSKTNKSLFNEIKIKKKIQKWWNPTLPGNPKNEEDQYRFINGKKFKCPEGRKWGLTQQQINELEKENRIKVDEKGNIRYAPLWEVLKNNWTNVPGYSRQWRFLTENAEIILKYAIESTSNQNDLVMDFFLGSGTTTAVAHKLKRKWIGIEMGDHFWSVILPRMKKVLKYDSTAISRLKSVKEKYNAKNAGGFFKYYTLEQYEQTLKRAVYKPSYPLIDFNGESIYQQYVFMKDLNLLDVMKLDYENNKIKINFDEIYPQIDLAETLSNLTGKWIKKIQKNAVVFEDESRIEFDNIDFNLIKPLLWW